MGSCSVSLKPTWEGLCRAMPHAQSCRFSALISESEQEPYARAHLSA